MKWNYAVPIAVGALLAACADSSTIPTASTSLVPTEAPALSRVAGAAFTTNNPAVDAAPTCLNGNQSGAAVNCNIYTSKKAVWINGGPSKIGVAGLSPGWYLFSVGVPSNQAHNPADGGNGNLSDTFAAGGVKGDPCADKTGCGDTYLNRRFYVDGSGEIAEYLGDGDPTTPDHETYDTGNGLMIRLMPYDNTSNPGGVYILALCQISTDRAVNTLTGDAKPSNCKYDAFKVRTSDNGGEEPNAVLDVYKTANAQYTRTYTWGIAKNCTPTSQDIALGGSASASCTVTLKSKYADGAFVISGQIQVTNNGTTPVTIDNYPVDALTTPSGPVYPTVDCHSGSKAIGVGPENALTCDYSYTLSSPPSDYASLYTNDASVTATIGDVPTSFPSNTVLIQFSDPATTAKTVNPCVTLSDDKVADAFGSTPFCYSSFGSGDNATGADLTAGWQKVKSLAPYTWSLVSQASTCGSTEYTNTATYQHAAIVGNVNSTTSPTPVPPSIPNNSASQTVTVKVYGCQSLTIRKYFDKNGNGSWDVGETEIPKWPVSVAGITGTPTAGITFTGKTVFTVTDAAASPLKAGSYTITEGLPAGWVSSFVYVGNTADYKDKDPGSFAKGSLTGTPKVNYALTLAAGALNAVTDKTVVFGNYCTQAANGWTLGFWSNNNGQARLAGYGNWQPIIGTATGSVTTDLGGTTLTYRLWQAAPSKNSGVILSPFVLSTTPGTPSTNKAAAKGSYLEFQNWLLGAQASTNGSALYMLSAQFAAAVLNAKIGGTDDKLQLDAVLPGTTKTVGQILTEAAKLLNDAAPGTEKPEYTTYIGYLNTLNNKGSVIPSSCALAP